MADASMGSMVIDLGSGSLKSGFSREAICSSVIPTVVGKNTKSANSTTYIGEEILNAKERVISMRVVERSVVTNWELFEKLMTHVYDKIHHASAKDHPLVITSHLYPRVNREKMTQIAFETFGVPSFYTVDQASASLFANNLNSGISVSNGYGACHIVPVYEGNPLGFAIQYCMVSGYDISFYLRKLLSDEGLETIYGRNFDDDIEKMKQMAKVNLGNVMGTDPAIPFQTHDGTNLDDIGPALRRLTEPFWNPELIEADRESIPHCIASARYKIHPDIRKELYENIVLSGGSTLFEGFSERLSHELKSILPESISFNLHAPENRLFSSWIGASKIANHDSFSSVAISKGEYEDIGPAVVDRKCF